MFVKYLILVSFFLFGTQALECGVTKKAHQKEVQKMMDVCLAKQMHNNNDNNKNNSGGNEGSIENDYSADESESADVDDFGSQRNDARIAGMRFSSHSRYEDQADSATRTSGSTSQADTSTYGNNGGPTNTYGSSGGSINERRMGTNSYGGGYGSINGNNQNLSGQGTSTRQNGSEQSGVDGNSRTSEGSANSGSQNDQSTARSASIKEANVTDECVVRCLLDQLEMMDSNGYPDQQKVAQGLLKEANGREVQDFLQESTDECFQSLEGKGLESCEYSTQLVLCLADKGKSNCADWPAGNLPFQQ